MLKFDHFTMILQSNNFQVLVNVPMCCYFLTCVNGIADQYYFDYTKASLTP